MSGSSGLIGQALAPVLRGAGHAVARLVRAASLPEKDAYRWRPEAGFIDEAGFEGVEAVVHLAGQSVAGGRWTKKLKAEIRDSRVAGTRLLCERLARMRRPPRVLLSASAIGYYGDRGGDLLREESRPGYGFLPEVCRAWEGATRPAQEAGVRVVHLRFGVVLSPAGGALARMLPPFRFGLGGRLGSGRQYLSWVAIDDVTGAVCHALARDEIEGPLNVVSPNPVTNETFTKTLGRVLRRPAFVPVPAPVLRALAGREMAEALFLASARVLPARLARSGYVFSAPALEGALRRLLGRP
ncbi:MAG: TIGR01777 family oxidoreductase [Myxococcota bacterium]